VDAQHSALGVEEAEDTVNELRAALLVAGITLPSLGLDPLVELGRCSVETARRLAEALR
jgi:hypothetical protein